VALARGVQVQPGRRHGSAVQVDPIKTKLTPPGTKRLKVKCDLLLSTSAFKINLRRYSMVWRFLSGYVLHSSPVVDEDRGGRA